ncbi:metallophosphoesterase family protein [Halioxenophilus aromaticivorans]|uniref:Metallophosphoesterase family protein n=2 Tax=Halioxenophilus aromaticivorans TaxID=1306992 RepID=A0AAV3TXM9_9ALTE
MRIALISDIHANVFALEAVLNAINNQGCDLVINLGDILYGPISPRETFEYLEANNCLTIKGNQDDDIIIAARQSSAQPNPTLAWVLEQLPSRAVQWLAELPDEITLEEVYVCHGAPGNNCLYLTEDVSTGLPYPRSDANIQQHLAGTTQPVIVCGHSHLPRAIWLESNQLVVNPGSVGLPAYRDDLPHPHAMETFSPHARYCLLDKTQHGWQVSQQQVPYPHLEAAKLARSRNRPDWAYALMTGRAVVTC